MAEAVTYVNEDDNILFLYI